MNLTASYQKDVKATKPKPATEAKAKPVEAKPVAKPEPAKPEPAKPKAETKPAKPSGTKRIIPTRRARKTQESHEILHKPFESHEKPHHRYPHTDIRSAWPSATREPTRPASPADTRQRSGGRPG